MSQYAVPEGYTWDEVSGKYVNIQILSDESGVKYRRIVLFDADSGTYDQQLIPISEQLKRQRPAPPPLPQGFRSASPGLTPRRRKNPVWLVPAVIGASILVIGIGVYFGYRKLKVDALGYGMMMNDEEVVELLDMDSFEEHVESFYAYDGDFIEEGIVK